MISLNFTELRHQLDSSITFDGDFLRRSRFKRSKAESQGFPSANESASADITVNSYGQIESAPEFSKFNKLRQNHVQIVIFSRFGTRF